jgi:hypothetical protein
MPKLSWYEGTDGGRPAQNILAISFSLLSASALFGRTKSFRLMMPSRHLLPASNTPDPEFPVVATSLITVENLLRTSKGSNCGDMMRDRAVPSGIATMTGSPAPCADSTPRA